MVSYRKKRIAYLFEMKKSEHVRNRAIGSGNVNGANIVNPLNIFLCVI